MRQFTIYHATGPYMFSETIEQPRTLVGFVQADSLTLAYVQSQNTEELWNSSVPCRSTSIGDVIMDGEQSFLVTNDGFDDITNIHKAIEEIEHY